MYNCTITDKGNESTYLLIKLISTDFYQIHGNNDLNSAEWMTVQLFIFFWSINFAPNFHSSSLSLSRIVFKMCSNSKWKQHRNQLWFFRIHCVYVNDSYNKSTSWFHKSCIYCRFIHIKNINLAIKINLFVFDRRMDGRNARANFYFELKSFKQIKWIYELLENNFVWKINF